MAIFEKKPLPGERPKLVRHKVLRMQPEPGLEWRVMHAYETGDQGVEDQGEYMFAAIRADEINRARHRGAPVPTFLEQLEEGGYKVEE